MLSVNNDAKTKKGTILGILTGILYLAPATIAGIGNLCAFASPGCLAACLYSAGRGAFSSVQKARIGKAIRFANDRPAMFRDLIKAIRALVRKAGREGLTPAVRLNGTSDIPWENISGPDPSGINGIARNLMTVFPDVQFYDYTKSFPRMVNFLTRAAYDPTGFPMNYHLTFSRSETNDPEALTVLRHGGSVAVVFRNELPETWNGFQVVRGDETDGRFTDRERFGIPAGTGFVVGLTAKGAAKRDTSGFVVD